jgi:hypothetical protein
MKFASKLRSNCQWDSIVLTALMTKYLLQQQACGRAIERINHGVLFRQTTSNLVPLNLSAANASAIYALLKASSPPSP